MCCQGKLCVARVNLCVARVNLCCQGKFMCCRIHILVIKLNLKCVEQSIACWDCGFEYHWGHRCLSLVSVVCFQVEVFMTGRSLVQGSFADCGVDD